MPRPRISGCKHRRDLALLALRDWPCGGIHALAQALSLACINLPFLLVQAGPGGTGAGLCVERDRRPEAEDRALAMAGWWHWTPPRINDPVAALTLYPLDGGMTLVAQTMLCLAEAGLGFLAMGTSPSALTVVLPEELLDPAMQALGARFQLPPGSSPPEERVKVVQSSVWRRR